jgi:arsenate reductase
MNITIYHNPRCSKSRKTLEILREAGIEPEIVAYLDTPPDADGIRMLAKQLGIPVNGLLRRGESEFREATDLPDLDDDAGLAAWLARHPRVMERPIVVDTTGGRAVIGRPPESVTELIR